jgi:hypothetical protein
MTTDRMPDPDVTQPGTFAEGQTAEPTPIEPQVEGTYAEGTPDAAHPVHPGDEGTFAEGMSDGDPDGPNPDRPATGHTPAEEDYVAPFTDDEPREDPLP